MSAAKHNVHPYLVTPAGTAGFVTLAESDSDAVLQAWALYPGATVTTRRLVLTDRPVAPSFALIEARHAVECAEMRRTIYG